MLATGNYFVGAFGFIRAKSFEVDFSSSFAVNSLTLSTLSKEGKKLELNFAISPKKRFGHCIFSLSLSMCTLLYSLSSSRYTFQFCRRIFSPLSLVTSTAPNEEMTKKTWISNKAFKFYGKVFQFFHLFFFVSFIVITFFSTDECIFIFEFVLQEKWKTGNNWMGWIKSSPGEKHVE